MRMNLGTATDFLASIRVMGGQRAGPSRPRPSELQLSVEEDARNQRSTSHPTRATHVDGRITLLPRPTAWLPVPWARLQGHIETRAAIRLPLGLTFRCCPDDGSHQ